MNVAVCIQTLKERQVRHQITTAFYWTNVIKNNIYEGDPAVQAESFLTIILLMHLILNLKSLMSYPIYSTAYIIKQNIKAFTYLGIIHC